MNYFCKIIIFYRSTMATGYSGINNQVCDAVTVQFFMKPLRVHFLHALSWSRGGVAKSNNSYWPVALSMAKVYNKEQQDWQEPFLHISYFRVGDENNTKSQF